MSAFAEITKGLERHKGTRLMEQAVTEACQAIDEGAVERRRVSFRRLFEASVEGGVDVLREWEDMARSGDGFRHSQTLQEAGVNTSHFSRITGQIVAAEIMQAYNRPQNFAASLIDTIPGRQQHGEKIIGLGSVSSDFDVVGEGQEYPRAAFGEQYIQIDPPKKRGKIIPVTKETLTFDMTGEILQRCQSLGEAFAYAKEKRLLETMLGITTSYRYNGRAAVATYGENSGDHDWDNLAASNALTDYESLNAAEQLFNQMTDPTTGDYIDVMADAIIIPQALAHKAARILSATEVRSGDITTGTGMQTIFANPVLNKYTPYTSALVKGVTSSDTTWFIGNFRKAFVYVEVEPMQVISIPAGSQDEFTRDVVAQYRVSEFGVAGVRDPRYVVKCTA